MLKHLFASLTAEPALGTALFDAATREARARHWYQAGEVADSLDGRFAALATVIALVMVRLEVLGEGGNRLSVALTERFVEVMEAEHREIGIGDPTLGKTVRKLVGALARRVGIWRAALAGEGDWQGAADASLPGGPGGASHRAAELRALADRLADCELKHLSDGEIS